MLDYQLLGCSQQTFMLPDFGFPALLYYHIEQSEQE